VETHTHAGAADAWEEVDLYRLFAFAFGTASRQRFAWLQQSELPAQLERLWDELSCEGPFPGVKAFADYEDYESTYFAVFEVGLPGPPVPLQESAHDTAKPAPETVLENTYFYDVLGLHADPAGYAPDHLVTQLEFLSAVRYLHEGAAAELNHREMARLERDFIERHLLNWLPSVRMKLAREDVPLFPVLMAILVVFVQDRAASLAPAGMREVSSPS
jgi:DMSO reductase family type II enzyme chaperone